MEGKWNLSGFKKKLNLKTQNKSMLVNEKYKMELMKGIKSQRNLQLAV